MAFLTIYHEGKKFVVFKEIAISFNLKGGDVVADSEIIKRIIFENLVYGCKVYKEMPQRIKYVKLEDLTDEQKP